MLVMLYILTTFISVAHQSSVTNSVSLNSTHNFQQCIQNLERVIVNDMKTCMVTRNDTMNMNVLDDFLKYFGSSNHAIEQIKEKDSTFCPCALAIKQSHDHDNKKSFHTCREESSTQMSVKEYIGVLQMLNQLRWTLQYLCDPNQPWFKYQE